MRVVLQRVKEASVTVENEIVGQIHQGLLLLVGITHTDTRDIVKKVADKIIGLRIFEDENQKMNLSLKDVGGSVLSVSQFTLYADYKRGRRPGFEFAAKPDYAKELYDYFNEYVRNQDVIVETGIFQADMAVRLHNDGPVTIMIDSECL